MNIIKNETLYNISLESPLLRDADLLSSQSIAETWRGTTTSKTPYFLPLVRINVDASLERRDALNEWVTKKVIEGEKCLDRAQEKLEEVKVLESEARALESLGENVL